MFPDKGAIHTGMLVRHEGMLAADKDVLLSNADNHAARRRRIHVLDNGMLISSKQIFLSLKRDCLGQLRKCTFYAKQSFRQTRASSCQTLNNVWAMQKNAGPKQGQLVDSFGQSYSRTRMPETLACLCYMKGCFLIHSRTCLCHANECLNQARASL